MQKSEDSQKTQKIGGVGGREEREEKGEKEELRGILHLYGKDINGALELPIALRQIKGIGIHLSKVFSQIIAKELSVSPDIKIGKLNDEQIAKVEEIIKQPSKYGVPSWLLDRRKDMESGTDVHLVGNELTFSIKQDIEREKNLYTWRGYRHAYGQKVRGQCTRTSGRKGLTVGVTRAQVKAAAAAAKTAEKKGGKEEKK